MKMQSIFSEPDEANKPKANGSVADVYKELTKWALVGLVIDIIVVAVIDCILLFHFKDRVPPYLDSLKQLLIHFIPLFTIAVFVDPLRKALESTQKQLSNQTAAGILKEAVVSELQGLRLEIRTIAGRRIPLSVTEVYETFQELPWDQLLRRATEVELVFFI